MPAAWKRIVCVQGDLTLERVDAVVNAANAALAGGGGVDGAIHRAAGPGLLAECRARHPDGCPTGQVRLTGGHDLPAAHVIHAVGPVWRGGGEGEASLLFSCYRAALELAAREGFQTLACAAISCGVYGYPLEQAAEVAQRALAEGLERHPGIRSVRMVLFSEQARAVFQAALERQAAVA